MRKISVLGFLFMIAAVTMLRAQEPVAASIHPDDPAFREKFSHLDFDGKFSIMAASDQVNNYYMADFTRLPLKFEKVYFLNLVFSCGKIVNIDPDLTQDRIWFLASNKYSIKEINQLFNELKEKTLKKSSGMTDEQKAGWMKDNDKYK